MRVLVISSNREKVPYPVMPIGAAFIASILEREGHNVRFLDLCFQSEPLLQVEELIKLFKPECICISMRNLDNCDYASPVSYLPEVSELIQKCRSISSAPIVLGGSAAGVMPEAVFRRLQPDYLVAGEGEAAVKKVVRALEKGEDPLQAGGVGTVVNNKWSFNSFSHNIAFEENVFPKIDHWCDIQPYIKHEGFYPLQTKRGCALKCIYCTYKNIEGTSYRFNPAERVVQEIEAVLKNNSNVKFEFVDSTFNSPTAHAMKILMKLKDLPLKGRFVGSGLNPISAPRELFSAMREAGFESLICTAENASETVLRNLKKGFNRKHLKKVASFIREEGLQTLWIFLLGGPGETDSTVQETLEFIHNDIGPKDVAYITTGLRIYPNTELANIALSEKVIASQEELIEPVFYFSHLLDPESVLVTLKEASYKDPRILRSVDAEHPWVPKLTRLIHLFGGRKPFWTFTPTFNRILNWSKAS